MGIVSLDCGFEKENLCASGETDSNASCCGARLTGVGFTFLPHPQTRRADKPSVWPVCRVNVVETLRTIQV